MKTLLCLLATLGLTLSAHAADTKTAQTDPATAQKAVEPSKEAPPVHGTTEPGESTTLTPDGAKNTGLKPETEKALKPLEKDTEAGKKKRKKK